MSFAKSESKKSMEYLAFFEPKQNEILETLTSSPDVMGEYLQQDLREVQRLAWESMEVIKDKAHISGYEDKDLVRRRGGR